MKQTLKKLFIIPMFAFALTVIMSWKTDTYFHSNALLNYLEKEDFQTNSKSANKESIDNFLNINNPQKKKIPYLSYTYFYYTLTQKQYPYLDANLKITVNGVERIFAFWNETGDFIEYSPSLCLLEVECPIYDQWDDFGIYQLIIRGRWDGTTYVNKRWFRDPSTTPDISSFYISLTVPYGTSYDITLSSR